MVNESRWGFPDVPKLPMVKLLASSIERGFFPVELCYCLPKVFLEALRRDSGVVA